MSWKRKSLAFLLFGNKFFQWKKFLRYIRSVQGGKKAGIVESVRPCHSNSRKLLTPPQNVKCDRAKFSPGLRLRAKVEQNRLEKLVNFYMFSLQFI